MKLEAHLKKIANSKSAFAIDVKSYLETVPVGGILLTKLEMKNWTRRCEKQLLPLHRVAYYLHPSNSKAAITHPNLAKSQEGLQTTYP